MKMNSIHAKRGIRRLLFAAVSSGLGWSGLMAADSCYNEEPQFHQWPEPKAARYEVSRKGPTGLGLELIQPAFTMRMATVEPGSPADATGQFKKGQSFWVEQMKLPPVGE